MCQEDRIRKLKGIIEDAFKDIPYPGDDNIADADHCFECHELAHEFRGKRWQEITLEFLWKGALPNGLLLLKPAAMRYYLPAYMIVSIEDFVEADVIPGFILATVVPDFEEPDSFFLERCEPLTSDQKRAVRLFLEYLVDEHLDSFPGRVEDGLLQRIEKYWGNY